METKPLDFNTLVLQELRNVQTGLTQLSAESEHIIKQLTRFETALDKLEARDNAQQKAIDGLVLNDHQFESALTVVSNTASDNARRLQVSERQYQSLADTYMQSNRRILDLEREGAARDAKIAENERRADAYRREWEPWAKGARWVVIGILAVAVGALAIWLLRDLAASILAGGI